MKLKLPFVILCFIFAGYVVLKINAAGEMRRARFNVTALYEAARRHFNVKQFFPSRLADLPKFYAVSAADKLYFSSENLNQNQIGGYLYHLNTPLADKIAISASPVRPYLPYVEFGITEKGILKVNQRFCDTTADSHEEVESWEPFHATGTAKSF